MKHDKKEGSIYMYKKDSANIWKDNSKKPHLLTYTRIGEDYIGYKICYVDW